MELPIILWMNTFAWVNPHVLKQYRGFYTEVVEVFGDC
jgi:hypothetical protein